MSLQMNTSPSASVAEKRTPINSKPRTMAKPNTHTSLLSDDNLARRALYVVLRNIAARFRDWDGHCVQISSNLILKTGYGVEVTEAMALQSIAAIVPSIPAPRVVSSFNLANRAFIITDKLPGKRLGDSGWTAMAPFERDFVSEQLLGMVQRVRAIEPPNFIASMACGGYTLQEIYDEELDRKPDCYTANIDLNKTPIVARKWETREDIPKGLPKFFSEEKWADIYNKAAAMDGRFGRPHFTHANLCPDNIMVNGTVVTGITGWKNAGWYSAHWEYAKLCQGWRKTCLGEELEPVELREARIAKINSEECDDLEEKA